MKKIVCTVLALVLAVSAILSLSSCGGLQSKIEKHKIYYYTINDYDRYQLTFENGKAVVDHQQYAKSSSSASGKILASSDEKMYEVKYVSDDEIEVSGTKYKVELFEHNMIGNKTGIRFDKDFLGLSKTWY